MVIQIVENCPAFQTYKGCGKAILVVFGDTPQQLIYLSEDADFNDIAFNITNRVPNSKVYYGMASSYEFVVEKQIM